jgi:hypothetical protein
VRARRHGAFPGPQRVETFQGRFSETSHEVAFNVFP